jgi:hypothetical protein
MVCHSKELRFRHWVLSTCVVGVIVAGAVMPAQTPPAVPGGTPTQTLTQTQLDNLVAPIALYPDPLVSQVLVACTYPLELVEAQQWLQANGSLSGQASVNAARQQNWDPSIQALVTMPDVLGKLTQNVQWTTDLGNAFLARQAGVRHPRESDHREPRRAVGGPDHASGSRSDLCTDLRSSLCLGDSSVG